MTDADALFELAVRGSNLDDTPSHPAPATVDDVELERVATWFTRWPDSRRVFADALRQSIDEVLDGQRTGRFDIDELEKTEKTYLGTKVEIVVRAAFGLSRGQTLDYRVDGIEVDAKYTTRFGGWMLPRESLGHICLLLHADDGRSEFSAGLLRVDPAQLRGGANQDGKRSLLAAHHDAIRWLHRAAPLSENLLLHLDPTVRNKIFRFTGRRDGQRRVTELFRLVHGRIVSREAVLTVGKQDDPMKRARDARKPLAEEGVVVLGHQNDHPRIAADLGLPIPRKGEFVAARLAEADAAATGPAAHLFGRTYTLAGPGDPSRPLPGAY